MKIEDLKDKKIAIIGLGMEGLDVLSYLKKNGLQASVLDSKTQEELGKNFTKAESLGANFILGENYLSNLSNFNVIFRSPGVKILLPEITEAEKRGVLVTSSANLFFSSCRGKIIGVTGTKGKGTTSTLIFNILKNSFNRTFIGGNVGLPMLSFLDEVKENDFVVLELSSFQLQDLKISPHIAIVLNITSEHLDYHATCDEYIRAKQSIVCWQKKEDFTIINGDYYEPIKFSRLTPAKKYFFSRFRKLEEGAFINGENIVIKTGEVEKIICHRQDLILRGEHNLENVCAASLAAFLAGAKVESISEEVKKFKGLEHRLEFVGELAGIKYYNDSFATTPEASIAAIRSFKEPIILIAGGSKKGSDFSELGKEIFSSSVKTLILIGDTAAEIKKASEEAGFKGKIIEGCKNMEEIFKAAKDSAKPDDIILLSPACASFGMFKNYKDRGNQFKSQVL